MLIKITTNQLNDFQDIFFGLRYIMIKIKVRWTQVHKFKRNKG